MKEKFRKYHLGFLLFCLFIAFLINIHLNCDDDPSNSDPVYGDGGNCIASNNINYWKLAGNTFGLYIFGLISAEFIKENHE